MTIITRANSPKQAQQLDYGCYPIQATGKVLHRKTNYKTMMHGLLLRLDREPTDSEIYAFLCEVAKC